MFVIACAFLCAAAAHAQRFDLDRDRQPVASLDGLWRFHPGDDPRWTDPSFDDSKWVLLRSNTDWSGQGYKDLSGFAWYRFSVAVPANSPPLSLYIPSLLTSYEVYADGVLIGGFGGMPPKPEADHAIPKTFALPRSTAAQHTVTFAIRVWHWEEWAMYYGGGPHAVALIGATALIEQNATETTAAHSWSLVDAIVLAILECLAGLAALGFFYLQPREREYLWFGLMLLFSTALRCFTIGAEFHRMRVVTRDDMQALLIAAGALATIAFYNRLLHGKRDWFFRLAVASVIASALIQFAEVFTITVKQSEELTMLLSLVFSAWVLTLLVRAARAGLADARLLLLPVLLQQAGSLSGTVVWISYLAGWQHTAIEDIPLSSWPFNFSLTDLAALLFLLAMLAILINRFTRSRREEERYAGEMEAARVVQQVLLPEPNIGLEGFHIEAEYLPAQEVGGDFYQIVPARDGGLLIVTGDVSGKGMPAAMLVALLVGAIRTEAAHTSDPAQLLAALNQRVHGRMSSGFATCAALHLSLDGTALLANAANPSPYLNGREIELPGALPLGMLAEVEYQNRSFTLHDGDVLTFVSDGIVEAQSAQSRELFGFDRTRAMSMNSALEQVQAARAFGQNDDITVLRVSMLADA